MQLLKYEQLIFKIVKIVICLIRRVWLPRGSAGWQKSTPHTAPGAVGRLDALPAI